MAINETKEKVVEEIPEGVEAEPLTQKEIETIAGELIKADPEKQKLMVDNIYAKSTIDLLNVASQFVTLVKKSMDSTDRRYKRFSDQCDVILDALNSYVKDGNVTKEEKAKAREDMMELIRMSNKARDDAEKSNNKKFWGVISVAALGVIGLIARKIGAAVGRKKD